MAADRTLTGGGDRPAGSPAPVKKTSEFNLPNVLTGLRIVMVPFFVWAMWAGGPWGSDSAAARWTAVVLFAVAMYTDKLDGDIARARGLVTNFGKIADPIADKLLTGSALVLFSLLGELWWWVTAVILVREWGITLMRFVVIRYGVMPAGRGGKLKTVLQAVGIGLLLMPLAPVLGDWWPWLGWTVIGVATVLTVLTGVEYVRDAVRLRRDWRAAHGDVR